jgi:hypothetical protein
MDVQLRLLRTVGGVGKGAEYQPGGFPKDPVLPSPTDDPEPFQVLNSLAYRRTQSHLDLGTDLWIGLAPESARGFGRTPCEVVRAPTLFGPGIAHQGFPPIGAESPEQMMEGFPINGS